MIKELRKRLGERIKHCRKKEGYSLESLGEKINITKSALSKVERGAVSITSDNLFLISEALDVSVDWLMKGEQINRKSSNPFFRHEWESTSPFDQLNENELAFIKEYIRYSQYQREHRLYDLVPDNDSNKTLGNKIKELDKNTYQNVPNDHVDIPLVGAAAAGSPMTAIGYLEGSLKVPSKYKDCFVVRVQGKSMEPIIEDRGYVIVRKQPTVENNEIALLKISGGVEDEVTIKRVKVEKNSAFLISDNPTYEPMTFNISNITILGKIVDWLSPEEGSNQIK